MEANIKASDSELLFPIRGLKSIFPFPSILTTTADGPRITCGPCLGASTFSTLCCEQEEWSSTFSALLLYCLALYRSLCQPFSEEVSRHDVITFTTIAAFWVEDIRVCSCPYSAVRINSPGGANHIGCHFINSCHIEALFSSGSRGSLQDVKLVITVKRKT